MRSIKTERVVALVLGLLSCGEDHRSVGLSPPRGRDAAVSADSGINDGSAGFDTGLPDAAAVSCVQNPSGCAAHELIGPPPICVCRGVCEGGWAWNAITMTCDPLGTPDTGLMDAGPRWPDASQPDATGWPDATFPDGGFADGGSIDAGDPTADAGFADAASADAGSGTQVLINFDELPSGTDVSSQYAAYVIFSSELGAVNKATNPSAYGQSPPNLLCTAQEGGNVVCTYDTYIDFTSSVSNLTFNAIRADDLAVVAQFVIYQSGMPTATVDLVGQNPGNVAQPVDLSAYSGITRLEITNITDGGGIGWDDFSFVVD